MDKISIDNDNALPYNSFGFHKGKSTINYLNELIYYDVGANRCKKLHTVAIITDISRAFDCVKSNVLIEKLENCKINPLYVRWINDFLLNRTYTFVNASDEFSIICTDDGLVGLAHPCLIFIRSSFTPSDRRAMPTV